MVFKTSSGLYRFIKQLNEIYDSHVKVEIENNDTYVYSHSSSWETIPFLAL